METPSGRLIFGILPWYSTLIVVGMILAILYAVHEQKRQALPEDTIIDLCLWLLPAGILGARLYYVIFSWERYREAPLRVFAVWEGGLAIYGGILAGLAVVLIFTRRRGIPLFQLLDILAPGLVLAQAIGRWGNYFNQEAFGLPVTDPSWQFFPASVLINGTEWHMATFFYESALNFAIFIFLILIRKWKKVRRGDLICWYALLYGCGRLVIEDLRMDSLMAADNSIRISQLLSVVLCIVCIARFVMTRPHPEKDLKKVIRLLTSCAAAVMLVPILPHLFNAGANDGQYTVSLMRFSLAAAASALLVYFTGSETISNGN